jgi:phosphoglycolate phosphatase
MAKKYDLLVFDWDGTLIDSTGAIVAAMQAACRDLAIAEPSDAQVQQVIGLGLADALRQCAPDMAEDGVPQIVDRYRHHYLAHDHELRLFDGVPELIAELHGAGYLLAVATGKSRAGLQRSMTNSGLERYFSATRCADQCFSKPHPQMLLELIEEFSLPAERALMIGDTTHDLQMAINAGVAGLAVDYGAHSAAALDSLRPLARLQSVSELTQWLRRHA